MCHSQLQHLPPTLHVVCLSNCQRFSTFISEDRSNTEVTDRYLLGTASQSHLLLLGSSSLPLRPSALDNKGSSVAVGGGPPPVFFLSLSSLHSFWL